MSPTGTETVAAGGGGDPSRCPGASDLVGDGCRATAAALDLNGGLAPDGVAVDTHGDLLIVDSYHGRVRMVAASTCSSSCPYGLASTTAGDIYTVAGGESTLGDGGPATAAIISPQGLTFDASGDLIFADAGSDRVRMVALKNAPVSIAGEPFDAIAGDIYTVAGDGASGSSGDGGPATAATLSAPSGVAFDPAGNLLITDTYDNLVRMVAASNCSSSCPHGLASTTAGDIYTVAGGGASGLGDGGPATAATLNTPASPWMRRGTCSSPTR